MQKKKTSENKKKLRKKKKKTSEILGDPGNFFLSLLELGQIQLLQDQRDLARRFGQLGSPKKGQKEKTAMRVFVFVVNWFSLFLLVSLVFFLTMLIFWPFFVLSFSFLESMFCPFDQNRPFLVPGLRYFLQVATRDGDVVMSLGMDTHIAIKDHD